MSTGHPPSLLQTALLSSKLHALDLSPGRRHRPLAAGSDDGQGADSEDDEGSVVGVETPGRAQSPAFGQRSSSRKRLSGAPAEPQAKSTDPLRAFPNDIGPSPPRPACGHSSRDHWLLRVEPNRPCPLRLARSPAGIQIFARLDFKSLARCARVSKRWNQSQTINYSAARLASQPRGTARRLTRLLASARPPTRLLLPPSSPLFSSPAHRFPHSLVPALQGAPVLARRGCDRDAPPGRALERPPDDPARRPLGPQGVQG